MALASCSSGGQGDEAQAPGTVGKDPETIVVAACCAVPSLVNLYAANALGYFKDENLDVTISETSTNTVNLIVSGQADIGVLGPGGILTTATEGKEVSLIYNYTRAGSPSLVGNTNITDPKQCRRIAGLAIGSSTYGGAELYNQKLGIGAEVVPMNDFPTILASLANGSIDCAAGVFTSYSARVDSGDLKLLIDTRDPAVRTEYWGDPTVAEGTYFGAKKNLEDKRDGVTRFLSAIDRANDWAATASPADIAQTLVQNPGFANSPPGQIAKDFTDLKSILHIGEQDAGTIPASSWPAALALYRSWGLQKLDPSNPALAYDKVVDMSYLQNATQCRQQKNCP